jgi:hypothetical protein
MTINLSNPINLSREKRTMCRALSATIWYDNPNVLTGINDLITVTINGTLYTWTLSQGLYSLDDIQETINEFAVNATPALTASTIKLAADDATGLISLAVTFTSLTWNFGVNNTLFNNLLGFRNFYTSDSGEWYESAVVASLNNLSAYLFNVSFCNSGYINNNSGQSVAHQVLVPPSQRVGTQIIDIPNNPAVSIVNQVTIDSFVVYITKEDGITPIRTNEPWSILLHLYTED